MRPPPLSLSLEYLPRFSLDFFPPYISGIDINFHIREQRSEISRGAYAAKSINRHFLITGWFDNRARLRNLEQRRGKRDSRDVSSQLYVAYDDETESFRAECRNHAKSPPSRSPLPRRTCHVRRPTTSRCAVADVTCPGRDESVSWPVAQRARDNCDTCETHAR